MKTHRDENKLLGEEADAQGWNKRREGRRCVRGRLENRLHGVVQSLVSCGKVYLTAVRGP